MTKATAQQKQKMKQYWEANKQKLLAKEKERREKKKEEWLKNAKCHVCGGKIPAYRNMGSTLCSTACKSKNDYKKHKNKRYSQQLKYRQNTQDRWNEYNREWRKNNPERARLTESKHKYGEYAAAHRVLIKLEKEIGENK